MSIPYTMFTIQALSGGEIIALPNPDRDSGKNIIMTFVNSGRNSAGTVIAQKICRDQEKTELKWTMLPKDIWEKLLKFWDSNFYFKFTYYSRVSGEKITRVFYIGDREDQPLDVDDDGIPTAYTNCVANVIDTGEGA